MISNLKKVSQISEYAYKFEILRMSPYQLSAHSPDQKSMLCCILDITTKFAECLMGKLVLIAYIYLSISVTKISLTDPAHRSDVIYLFVNFWNDFNLDIKLFPQCY